MAHIELGNSLPGILGPFAFRPETGRILSELAQTLLRGPSTLTPGERELIASTVSRRNQCNFCFNSHFAATEELMDPKIAEAAIENFETAPISEKMKGLIQIAHRVQVLGKEVTTQDIARAKRGGATDLEIHDTVLIAAAFCMYNRYVDGLGTDSPPHHSPAYKEMGVRLATQGYLKA